MERKEMKRIIDTELNEIVFTDIMKKKVFKNSKRRISHPMLRYAAMIILTFMIGGTTVFAGYYFLNKVNVNKITLPELDAMQIGRYYVWKNYFIRLFFIKQKKVVFGFRFLIYRNVLQKEMI